MIGMLIFGLLRLPRPADAPAEPPPAATAAAIQPAAAAVQAATTAPAPIRPVSGQAQDLRDRMDRQRDADGARDAPLAAGRRNDRMGGCG